MRKINSFVAAIILLPLLFIMLPVEKVHAQDAMVSYQDFYDNLSPYGQWVSDPAYGNVWIPNVESGFRPYSSDGYWAMTENGNMWVSDRPWAWAAYHYGRWTYNGYYGWVWIPGHEWAPAWVNWRSGGGYYGWAPMGPGQVYGGMYEYPDNYWVFVNPNYLYRHNVYNYYEHGDMRSYVYHTNYITYEGGEGRYYGPRREVIERETHQPVQVYRVSDAREAGAGHMGRHEVSIYRPAVNRESEHSARPANVMEGRDHPIGNRQEAISADHENRQPAFRQEHNDQQRPQQPQYNQQGRGQQQNNPSMNNQQGRGQQQNNQSMNNQQQQQRPQQQNNNQQGNNQQQQRPQQQQNNQQQQQRPQQQQQQRPQHQQQQQHDTRKK